ncbi:hypothetical protein I8D64_05890 [Brachybacterium sp. MASK1Z-5]|uniref:Uncharacterized protein n=1 Tax=Brachybacterium halotolerans TaxID=2795215 RepID=A0ABS1B8E5_9MICO|nr:hypothetical protein [Brachybacterium halotolerans]MBK0330932.1 hypothetical protein [Brachybacterium halotolerans]
MSELERYTASEPIEQIISSVLIGYRLAIRGGTPVESMPWHRDDTLPRYSVRVSTPDDTIVYTAHVWAGRDDELEEHLRRWLLERINIAGTKRGHGRRPNPWWSSVRRKANPGRA